MSTNDCKYFVLFSNEVFACLILIRHLMMLMMMYLLFLNSYSPIALFLPLSNSTNFILLTFVCCFIFACWLEVLPWLLPWSCCCWWFSRFIISRKFFLVLRLQLPYIILYSEFLFFLFVLFVDWKGKNLKKNKSKKKKNNKKTFRNEDFYLRVRWNS